MDIKFHSLKKHDYRIVAELHSDYINNGFLSTLGVPFLSLLYEVIDLDDQSVLLTEKVDNVVVGFVSGTHDLARIYKKILFKPFRLIYSLKSCFLSPVKIIKIIELIYIIKRNNIFFGLPNDELLSIVVNPVYQGRGHAENLFNSLSSYFSAKGTCDFRIVVGSDLKRAHAFYSKMGAVPVKEVQIHNGFRSVVYFKNLIKVS